MSAIALFNSAFTLEEEIRTQLAEATGFEVIEDEDLINEAVSQFSLDRDKVERCLYGPSSVFNRFTLERESVAACLKLVMAQYLSGDRRIFSGLLTHLIPSSAAQVLKVGVIDEKSSRIHRAVEEGLSEKNAEKLIKKKDAMVGDWLSFLLKKTTNDPGLYDIFFPLGNKGAPEVVQLILENYRRPPVLITEQTKQAVTDMALAAAVEKSLLDRGYTNEVQCSEDNITLLVNKSVHNFSRLAESLTAIAGNVPGVRGVKVAAGKDYRVSVYRDQEFSLPPKVLLVDDEQEFVRTLSDRLNTRSYGSFPVFDGEQAMDLLSRDTPDVMVLDLKMPGMQGGEVLKKTKEAKPEVEVIILTGHGTEEDKQQCLEQGAYAYLQKPVDISQLMAIIDEAYRKKAQAKVASD
ncbi:response regulator [Desulfogranum mediterraneum]|uniref:response regulator n=1 Tax=Desulfogranum mediterraneum TaxID=160661 RepID=UPI00041AB398|nr:response regulator [Desulfogranum mediterraneum]